VVADLLFVWSLDESAIGDLTANGDDGLPRGLVEEWKAEFPYYLPVVYRSGGGRGRYVVFAVSAGAVRECGG
jgi:hypothetical protein